MITSRARDEPETCGEACLGYQPVHLQLQLRERRRATPFSHRHCVVTARFTATSCPSGRVPPGAPAADRPGGARRRVPERRAAVEAEASAIAGLEARCAGR